MADCAENKVQIATKQSAKNNIFLQLLACRAREMYREIKLEIERVHLCDNKE